MWNLKAQFEKLEESVDFLNKIIRLNRIEYHIEKENNIIYLTSDNEYDKDIVLDILAENIVKTYKSQYFFKNIKLHFLPNEYREALINALILFDIDSDIYCVLLNLQESTTVIVKAFSQFKLKSLIKKWKEFVFIANLNGSSLINYDIFIEFLKLIITSVQPKANVVNLKSDLSNFIIVDDNNNLIAGSIDLKDEMGLLTNLVLLAPRNINIYCAGQVSDKTFNALCYLFDKKINLLV